MRRLVHGDLLNHNVLVDNAGVPAILNRGDALYGDYLYDAAWLIYWWPWYPAWQGIDIRHELFQHWRSIDGQLPDQVEVRLLAYQLHIGLDSMAYCSFKGRWDDVADSALRVLELAVAG